MMNSKIELASRAELLTYRTNGKIPSNEQRTGAIFACSNKPNDARQNWVSGREMGKFVTKFKLCPL